MIIPDLESPRLRGIAPSTEDISCESGSEIVGSLRDADAVKWRVTWNSGFDRWIAIKTEGATIALTALFHDVVHPLSLHDLEQISEDSESGLPQEIRELVWALSSEARNLEQCIVLLSDSPAISETQARRLDRCLAGYTWSKAKADTKADVKVLDSFTGRVERIDQNVACVRFVDTAGGISFAQVDAVDLIERGIGEGDSFVCDIKEKNGETTMVLTAVPRAELSDADYREIDRKLDEALPDSLFDRNE